MYAAFFLPAQDKSFTFQHYGPEDGLSSSNIQSIKQHRNALIYLATQNGVYTFDGYNFLKLKTGNLQSNFIRNINFDGNDLMIVNREEGVFKYDPQTKSLTEDKNLKFKTVDELVLAGDYAYSLTDQISVSARNIKTNTLIGDKIKDKDLDNQAFCIFKTSGGEVLVGRKNGLYRFNGGEQEKIQELKNTPVYSIAQDKDGRLVLGSDNKIILLDKFKIEKELHPKFKTTSRTFLFTGEQKINKLIVDKYNRYWFTSYPETNLYLYENGNVSDVFERLNISPTLISCLLKDKYENIWVGTYSDGVYFIQNPFFTNVSFSFNQGNLAVNEVAIKDNIIFSATNNGLYSYNMTTFTTKVVSKPDAFFPEQVYNIMAASGNVFYYSKAVEFNGTSPISITEQNQSFRLHPIISKFVYPLNGKEAIIANRLGYVLKINLATQKVLDTLISYPDYRIRINSILVKGDELFVGTSNGLTVYNLSTRASKPVSDPAFNFSINHIAIVNNKVYLAHEGGFTVYDDKKLIAQIGDIHLTAVKKIKFYKDYIWLATLDGLYLCDIMHSPKMVFNKSNGLLSNSINDVEFHDDVVCIATNRGISVSTFEDIKKNHLSPEPVKLTLFETDDHPNYNISGSIKLKADQSSFKVHFLSPLFNKPNKQTFRYKLDNDKWTYFAGNEVSSAVTGGRHSLQISSSFDNINWSEPVIVAVEKEITFAETPWFYVSITAGALVLIIVISYIWIKQVKKKALRRVQEEQQINLLKHQAMNSLLSPHFIFNSLTSIQNYINTNNSLMASEYLAKFSRLIRMIIEKAAQSQITLKDEVTRLNYYLDLEKERFKQKFDFVINVADNLDVNAISIPNMIIQPHAENSIIHGILPKNEHGTLSISFLKSGNNLLIRIEDDGIGLIKAREHAKSNHKSLGTSTITNILELNSKLYNKKQSVKMEDKSTLNPPANGTLITITLEL
ncbi:MAG: histidine kinase [Bacteroidia bacterium]